jgi:adenylate kinase family enzyme
VRKNQKFSSKQGNDCQLYRNYISFLDMYRIHVLGASGSGVSTLGCQLGRSLGINTFDCDSYYWEKTDPPFIKATPIPDRQNALLTDLRKQDSWVCTGSMDSWSEPFESLFTNIIFLYVPAEVRIRRLRDREKKLWGSRILEGGDMFHEHEKFISWAAQYDEGLRGGRSLPRHKIWLSRQCSPVLTIEGDLNTEESLNRALNFLRFKN